MTAVPIQPSTEPIRNIAQLTRKEESLPYRLQRREELHSYWEKHYWKPYKRDNRGNVKKNIKTASRRIWLINNNKADVIGINCPSDEETTDHSDTGW